MKINIHIHKTDFQVLACCYHSLRLKGRPRPRSAPIGCAPPEHAAPSSAVFFFFFQNRGAMQQQKQPGACQKQAHKPPVRRLSGTPESSQVSARTRTHTQQLFYEWAACEKPAEAGEPSFTAPKRRLFLCSLFFFFLYSITTTLDVIYSADPFF